MSSHEVKPVTCHLTIPLGAAHERLCTGSACSAWAPDWSKKYEGVHFGRCSLVPGSGHRPNPANPPPPKFPPLPSAPPVKP